MTVSQTAPNGSQARSSSIDVVVATRNRPDDMARMIPTLLSQSHANFSCLIVDQSDDPKATASLIAGLGDHRVRHIVHRAKGKSLALNLALSQTSAEAIAFTDDDCTLPNDWLSKALGALARLPGPGIVFGNVRPGLHDSNRFFIPSIEFDRYEELTTPLLKSPGLIGMGANMIVSRTVFERAGKFDEDLGPGGPLKTGEECELSYRALRRGFVVAQDPALDVVHWGARPLANDVARELVVTGFFAIGAGYGKHIRTGDWRAAVVSLHDSASVLALFASALARRRGPFHLRRLGLFWRGIAEGVRRGPRVPTTTPNVAG